MSRKLGYNKKRGTFVSQVNTTSKNGLDTLSVQKSESVYFFIANTSKVEINKMIATSFRTFITKVLVFTDIYLLFFEIGGRHSHQMFLGKLYTNLYT